MVQRQEAKAKAETKEEEEEEELVLKPPLTPPIHKDRLFEDLKKYTCSPRATQLVPNYQEFRLGHGDPLLKAVMDHWIDMANPHHHHHHSTDHSRTMTPPELPLFPSLGNSNSNNSNQECKDDYEEKEIHLVGKVGSPLCGFGINDIVHVDKDTIMSFPCLPVFVNVDDDDDDDDDDGVDNENYSEEKEVRLVGGEGSPLCGVGTNDIVHIDKDTIISLPCLPVTTKDDDEDADDVLE